MRHGDARAGEGVGAARSRFALLQGRFNEAKVQADRAMQNLKNGTPPWQRASDVKEQAERGAKEQRGE